MSAVTLKRMKPEFQSHQSHPLVVHTSNNPAVTVFLGICNECGYAVNGNGHTVLLHKKTLDACLKFWLYLRKPQPWGFPGG